jgi:hypothetical protein
VIVIGHIGIPFRYLIPAGVSANMKPVVEIQQPVHWVKSKPLTPEGNPSGVVNAGLFCDPSDDFLVGRACPNELFEFSGINAGEFEKCTV